MRILGIDPGTQRVGFAVLDVDDKTQHVKILDLGVWDLLKLASKSKSPTRPDLGLRLEILYSRFRELVQVWNPRWIGLEKAVSFRNVASAHTLSEARGVLRLVLFQCLENAEKRMIEMSPTTVKRFATGFGGSDKRRVENFLRLRIRGLEEFSKKNQFSFDAYDALAIAWSAWNMRKREELKSWPQTLDPSLPS